MALIYIVGIVVNFILIRFMLSAHLTKQWYYFSKICKTSKEAIEGIVDHSKLLVGGFGICGVPMNLINAVK
jgi:hypothetical protein